jgi:DNA gyrase inhibitor GyrI
MKRPIAKSLALLLLLIPLCSCVEEASSLPTDAPKGSVSLANFDQQSRENLEPYWGEPSQGCVLSFDSNREEDKEGFSLKLDYNLNPPNNNLNGYRIKFGEKITDIFDGIVFYVKGDMNAGFTTEFNVIFKSIKESGTYPVTGVTNAWKIVPILFSEVEGISDWSKVSELDILFDSQIVTKPKGTIYINDIFLSPGCDLETKQVKSSDLVIGDSRTEILIDNLKGFPKNVLNNREMPKTDKEFLQTVARDTWGYFRDIVDKKRNIPLNYVQVAPRRAVGDYVSTTDLGLYLMSVVSAYDLGFIDRKGTVERIRATLDTAEKLEKAYGFMYNYYDTTRLNPTSNFISFVDSGWFIMGLIIVRQAFPEEMGERCTRIIDSHDFSFFYDRVQGQMRHGYHIDQERYSEYHYGAFYTEARAISLMAIGKGDVPPEHWFKIYRTFPKEWKWTYYASVEVSKFDDLPLGLFGMALPASKYAVFTVKGDLSNIGKMFRYAYDEWLPKSNYQSAFPFDFEYYDARFRHDKPESSEIDIYLPIKRRET